MASVSPSQFDLSSFKSTLGFSLLETIPCSGRVEYSDDEMDRCIWEEFQPVTSAEFYNHDSAFKLLELSERLLLKRSIGKWKKNLDQIKGTQLQVVTYGLVNLNYLLAKKTKSRMLRSFLEILRVSQHANLKAIKYQRLTSVCSCIFYKYYSAKALGLGFQSIQQFSNMPLILSIKKLQTTISLHEKNLARLGFQSLKQLSMQTQRITLSIQTLDYVIRHNTSRSLQWAFQSFKKWMDFIPNDEDNNSNCRSRTQDRSVCLTPILTLSSRDTLGKDIDKTGNEQFGSATSNGKWTSILPTSSEFLEQINTQAVYPETETSILFGEAFIAKRNDQLAQNISRGVELIFSCPYNSRFIQDTPMLTDPFAVYDSRSIAVYSRRPDQEYRTLNDQVDSNSIFNCQPFKVHLMKALSYKSIQESIVGDNPVTKKPLCPRLQLKNPLMQMARAKSDTQLLCVIDMDQQKDKGKELQTPNSNLQKQKQPKQPISWTSQTEKQQARMKKAQMKQFLHRVIDRKRKQLHIQIQSGDNPLLSPKATTPPPFSRTTFSGKNPIPAFSSR